MQQSINLLYPATIAVSKTKKGPDLFVVVLGATLILVCSVLYGYLHYQEVGLNARIAKANVEIEELSKPLPGEVARRPLIKERNDLKKAIQDITGTRKVISRPMDQIANVSDPNVTLTSVEVKTKPVSILVNGTAPSQTVVSRFMGNLQQSQYFRNSYIKSSRVEFIDNRKTVEFIIQITPSEGVFK